MLQSPVGGLKGLALIPVWDGNVMAAVDGLRSVILGQDGHGMTCFHCWRSEGTARWVWRFTKLLALLGLHLRAAVVGERVSGVPFCCVWVVAPDVIGEVVSSGGQF